MDKEYITIVSDILNNEEFLKRKNYLHHENESVYDHCLKVSYMAYKKARKKGLNYQNVAIGGLLHDFYYKPWQDNTEHKKLFKKHGFVHAREAYENASIHFPLLMNDMVKDIILRHMFPLNIKLPKYRESWIVTFADKKCSLSVFKYPKSYLKYLGMKGRKK